MRRRHNSIRASLTLAVLVTALTLLLGSVLTSTSESKSPVATSEAGLAAASTSDRVGSTSRDLSRPTASASDAGPPSYAVQDSGQPIAETPSASPTPLPPFKVKGGKKLRKLPPGPVPGDPFTLDIGTLNVLGSQHARNGTGRAAALAGAIMGRGVDIVGLQEVQDDQLATMNARLSGYTVWPGQALGNQGVRLQIAFRDSMFELVDTGSISTTFDFQQRPIPYVLLREKATQAEFYVIDIHNSPGGQEAARDAATGAEIALVNQLKESGKPVFLMGDTNEHTEFACRVADATGMVGSNGLNASGGCSVGVGPIKIDHILGLGGVDFFDHVVDYGAPVGASTDHAFVHASVTVTPLIPPADAAAQE